MKLLRYFSIGYLLFLSLFMLLVASRYWFYTPDGGIYIGTALNIIDNGQYVFNGYPNLQYYPGFSVLLSIPLAIFGLDFYALNIFSAIILIALIWSLFAYFEVSRYGSVIIFLPLILFSNDLFQQQIIFILSEAPFLLIVILIAWLCRQYSESPSNKILFLCLLLTAIAPLFRFEGLFVILSFSLFLLINEYRITKKVIPTLIKTGIISIILILPFAGWTLRNYLQFTPETYNMASRFFFGLDGLRLYAPDFFKANWIEADSWKYGLYNFYFNLRDIGNAFVGHIVERNTLADTLIKFIFFISVFVFGLYGLKEWLKKANYFEIFFVIFLSLFIFYRSITAHSLYVVARYWLPLLPFFIAITLIGYKNLKNDINNVFINKIISLFGIITLTLIIVNGIMIASANLNSSKELYYKNAETRLNEMSAYITEHTNKKTVLATTDWGVLPLFMHRKSISVLNDDAIDFKLTLQRILKFRAEYLVILDDLAVFYKSARIMAEKNPDLFQFKKDFISKDNIGPKGSIYKINLDNIKKRLNTDTKNNNYQE